MRKYYLEQGYISIGFRSDNYEILFKNDMVNNIDIYWYIILDEEKQPTTPHPLVIGQELVELLYKSNHWVVGYEQSLQFYFDNINILVLTGFK